MNISNVFERLLHKPELYLGAKSLTRLWIHLQGYMTALDEAKISYDDQEFGSFCRWVEKTYNLSGSHSWANVVLFVSFGDECRAIEKAKTLWEEFKNQKT